MILKNDDLWNSTDPIILITGNSYINSKGELVMGMGAALELKNKFPYLPYRFGKIIMYGYKHLGEYNVIMSALDNSDGVSRQIYPQYGVFQVKYHYADDADIDLIKRSVDRLNVIVELLEKNVSMNFPGIGCGRLKPEDVIKVINNLSDRVTIYYK